MFQKRNYDLQEQAGRMDIIQSGKEKTHWDLTTVFKYTKRGYKEDRDEL